MTEQRTTAVGPLFMGLDIGTQGARVVVADSAGTVFASATAGFASVNIAAVPGYREQAVEDWWRAAQQAIGAALQQLPANGRTAAEVAALAVDGTSGTIVPLGKDNQPLRPAIMYNDPRAGDFVEPVRAAAGEFERKYGLAFGSSFALPRILWLKKHEPELFARTAVFAHQADYIVGRLSGNFRLSDASNALKTGYDPLERKWPNFIQRDLGLDTRLLPDVSAPGVAIATVDSAGADATGLPRGAAIIAGATDGYASMLASGSASPGDWTSIIGTTLVIKGITENLCVDPQGRVYSHLHPQGWWMPGGAGNCGGGAVDAEFARDEFETLAPGLDTRRPSGALVYPLAMKGERFPFIDPNAESFCLGHIADRPGRFQALLEGVGYAERLSFDMLAGLGCEIGEIIHTAGGACRSVPWLQIRANILNRQLLVPESVDAAMGSAMLAASGSGGGLLSDIVPAMTTIKHRIDPQPEAAREYDELYNRFVQECEARYTL